MTWTAGLPWSDAEAREGAKAVDRRIQATLSPADRPLLKGLAMHCRRPGQRRVQVHDPTSGTVGALRSEAADLDRTGGWKPSDVTRTTCVQAEYIFGAHDRSPQLCGRQLADGCVGGPPPADPCPAPSCHQSKASGKEARARGLVNDQQRLIAFGSNGSSAGHDFAAEQPAEPPGVKVAAFERLVAEMLPQRDCMKGGIDTPVGRSCRSRKRSRRDQRRHPLGLGRRMVNWKSVPGIRPGNPRCFSMGASCPAPHGAAWGRPQGRTPEVITCTCRCKFRLDRDRLGLNHDEFFFLSWAQAVTAASKAGQRDQA